MNKDLIINKLLRKAKTGVEVLLESENDFTYICKFSENIDECLNCKCLDCRWKNKKKWILLDDVLEILENLFKDKEPRCKETIEIFYDNQTKADYDQIVGDL